MIHLVIHLLPNSTTMQSLRAIGNYNECGINARINDKGDAFASSGKMKGLIVYVSYVD